MHASHYERNLVNFIKALRKDFNAPNAKFVLATMGEATKDMAILAVSEGGLPVCRKATLSRQPAPPAFPPPFSSPTRPKRPEMPRSRWRISRLPPTAEKATAACRRTKAGKSGAMVGDDVKQRSDNFSDT